MEHKRASEKNEYDGENRQLGRYKHYCKQRSASIPFSMGIRMTRTSAADHYDHLYQNYRWHVPADFNIAHWCCTRWANDANRVAIYMDDEKDGDRIIAKNAHWIAFVPYAARYPFEIHLAPLQPVADLAGLSPEQSDAFPEISLEIMRRLDGVFGIEMAYIATWHQAPVREGRDLLRLHWQITSVRRAPGKLKYLAGSESAMGAFIMDLKPEQSAGQLRDVVIAPQ